MFKKLLATTTLFLTLTASTAVFAQPTHLPSNTLDTVQYGTTVCYKTLISGKKIYIVVDGYICPIGWYPVY